MPVLDGLWQLIAHPQVTDEINRGGRNERDQADGIYGGKHDDISSYGGKDIGVDRHVIHRR
jgi:hypothetical protein